MSQLATTTPADPLLDLRLMLDEHERTQIRQMQETVQRQTKLTDRQEEVLRIIAHHSWMQCDYEWELDDVVKYVNPYNPRSTAAVIARLCTLGWLERDSGGWDEPVGWKLSRFGREHIGFFTS